MLMVVTNLVFKGSSKNHISTKHRQIRKYFFIKKGPFVNYKFNKIWY